MLTLNFFKRLGFSTKTDGMHLFNKNKEIQEKYEKGKYEVEELTDKKLDSLYDYIIDNHEGELLYWKNEEKKNKLQRKIDKEDNQKKMTKKEMREEIKREMKEEEINEEHPELKFDKCKYNSITIEERLREHIYNTKLTPKKKDNILKCITKLKKCEGLLKDIDAYLA